MYDATLSIDLETYSELDIRNVGVYRYVEHPSFEILMMAYELEMGGQLYKGIFDLKNTANWTPEESNNYNNIGSMILNPRVLKKAFNANFERTCLAKHYGQPIHPEQWICTAVQARELGFPGSLGEVAKVLGLDEDKQKMKEGKALISYFSKPCKPTKTNGGRTRNLPEHAPERWQLFLDYCQQDVTTESEVARKLSHYSIPESEWRLWRLDQHITDRGVKLDRDFIDKAVELDTLYKDKLLSNMKELTKLPNPGSDSQLKKWLGEKTGESITSVAKGAIDKIIEDYPNIPEIGQVLDLRKQLKKTSTSKYYKMQEVISEVDDRARGLIQFYGAGRTGRWAGRLVQVQNLPRNNMEGLDLARSTVKTVPAEFFDIMYDNVPDTLSQLIRTAFVPENGHLFYVADFSAIEARVIAWLAGESWRMDVFNTHGKIYEASASQMFKVDIDTIAKGHENYALRQKGKIAELALGYGGAVGALKSMGALKMGLEEKELKPLVNMWRKTNPAIVQLWWDIGDAAMAAVRDKINTTSHGVNFRYQDGILFCDLPSGRSLAYVKPRIDIDSRRGEKLTYEGMDQTKHKWTRIDTYGPKLVENIVQALSRDCLAFSIENLERYGYKIVMHVHDEVIIDHATIVDPDTELESIEIIMKEVPAWAEGLPLNADGYHCEYYKKD